VTRAELVVMRALWSMVRGNPVDIMRTLGRFDLVGTWRALELLEARGLVSFYTAPGGPERGNREQRIYSYTPAGAPRGNAEANEPSGAKLIEYMASLRRASERRYPDDPLKADSWHMGWFARRIGRPRTDGGLWSEQRQAAWEAGWDAAMGTWAEVGPDYMPAEE